VPIIGIARSAAMTAILPCRPRERRFASRDVQVYGKAVIIMISGKSGAIIVE
jgi:hypothetical protein